jgi:hypothetical protein
MINVDDESFERCGSTSEADGRSVQGDRIDSSVTSVVHPGHVTYVTRERISKTTTCRARTADEALAVTDHQ